MSFRPLIIGALLALFVSAAAAQTKSELIKEILGLRKALTQFKYLGRYTLVVTAMDKVIPKLDTFPEDGDLSIIGKKTILIPQNEALGAVGVGSLVKNGTSPEQIVTFLEMGLLHILDGYYPFREIKHSSSVPTLLPGRRLRKYFVPLLMRRGSPYALGQSWNGLSWSQIVNPGIYRGKYIVVHGVDALQQP